MFTCDSIYKDNHGFGKAMRAESRGTTCIKQTMGTFARRKPNIKGRWYSKGSGEDMSSNPHTKEVATFTSKWSQY
jgi:hypothetical protein